jgi:hyperosmotically inducible protein
MLRKAALCHWVIAASLCVGVTAVSAQNTSPAPATSANNTGVNQRDRDSHSTTPMDQPNDKADVDLVAHVRKAIVKDGSLSTNAHNVKIVAASGVVTLRGPVRNDAERSKVEALASGVTGVQRVDNQLDIQH